ncbi:MAG: hypothetical protein RL635_1380 [Chloroflexota bacterium]
MTGKRLRVIPFGGLGEVGKNMMAFEYGRNIVIVDAGLMFPANDMWGIDYIIPDMNYLEDKLDWVRGVIITHGHEDHTGAIKHVMKDLRAPIYATAITRGLLENKLREARLLDKLTIQTVQAGEKINLGPFDVEFFHTSHSIPDSVGLAITTPVGLVVHTGDFKLDPTPVDGWPMDLGKLAEFGERGVLALFSDSTNAEQPGRTPSEAIIDGAMDEVFTKAQGRVLVATFASLISRSQQVINAATKHKRKVAMVGTSMVENSKLALKLGYLKDPGNVLVSLETALEMPHGKVALMMTGSQGEPSSILARLAQGNNRQFDLEAGDTVVVSAHPIPGNEEVVARTVNKLFQRGAHVIYDPLLPVHVSGHASSEEQSQLIALLKPKYFVPVHGELRMLHAHAKLAKQAGVLPDNVAVVENGTVLVFTTDSMTISERVPGGYVYVDGAGVGDIGPEVLRDRDRLANYGFVIVSLLVDSDTRQLVNKPEMISRGFVYVRDATELFNNAAERVVKAVRSNPNGNLARHVEGTLADYFYAETKRRPMVFAVVNEV